MKKIIAVALIVVLAFGLISCTEKEAGVDEKKDPIMALVMPKTTNTFMEESILLAEAEADKIKAESGTVVTIFTSKDSAEQNQQLEKLIEEKATCVILWPHDGEEARAAAKSVMDAKIPLVLYNNLIDGLEANAEIVGDNITIGTLMGDYFNAFFQVEIGEGEVNILEFKDAFSTASKDREEGFKTSADVYLKSVGQFNVEGQRAKAVSEMEKWLQSTSIEEIQAVKGIVTQSDEVALGILDAIKNYSGPATLDIRLISSVGGTKENLIAFPEWETKGIKQVTFKYSPSMIVDAIQAGLKINVEDGSASEKVVIETIQIDNGNAQQYLEEDGLAKG